MDVFQAKLKFNKTGCESEMQFCCNKETDFVRIRLEEWVLRSRINYYYNIRACLPILTNMLDHLE